MGTFNLIEQSREYIKSISKKEKDKFLFVHISTDEVFPWIWESLEETLLKKAHITQAHHILLQRLRQIYL